MIGANSAFAPSLAPIEVNRAEEVKEINQLVDGVVAGIDEEFSTQEEESKSSPPQDCTCDVWRWDIQTRDEIQKEIQDLADDIIQLEQSLIELDEQNTENAIEIRKCNAKIILYENEKTSDGEATASSEVVEQLEQ